MTGPSGNKHLQYRASPVGSILLLKMRFKGSFHENPTLQRWLVAPKTATKQSWNLEKRAAGILRLSLPVRLRTPAATRCDCVSLSSRAALCGGGDRGNSGPTRRLADSWGGTLRNPSRAAREGQRKSLLHINSASLYLYNSTVRCC